MTFIRARLIASCAAAVALSVAGPAAASCKLDYGKKLLKWVERDTAAQSRALAKADYEARSFNTLITGFDELHKSSAQVSEQLARLEDAIREAELRIDVRAAASDGDREVVTALLRDADASSILDILYAARAELLRLKTLHDALMADPTEKDFREKGLQNIGRSTLVASLQEMGDLSQLGLSQRYGFYIGATMGEDGSIQNVQVAPSRDGDMYDSIALAASFQIGLPYGPFVYATYFAVRVGLHERDCEKKRKEQDRLVAEASELLPTQLIQPGEQFTLYDSLYKARRAEFVEHSKAYQGLEQKLLERWKQDFAWNSARSATARAILTTAKIAEVRRRAEREDGLARLFDNLGRAQLAKEVGDLGRYEARLELAALSACQNVQGLKVLEQHEDALGFASESFALYRGQAAFAPLQPLLDARAQATAQAKARAATRRAALPAKPCGTALAAPEGRALAVVTMATTAARLPRNRASKDATSVDKATAIETATDPKVPAIQTRAAVAKMNPAEAQATASALSIASNVGKMLNVSALDARSSFDLCVLWSPGNGVYSCGSSGHAGAYGSQFSTGGDPMNGVMGRATDGGFRADARISAGIDGVRRNIEDRIADVRTRSGQARAALPAWQAGNAQFVTQQTAADDQGAQAAASSRIAFQNASSPATAQAQAELASFLQGPSDPAGIERLLGTVGTAQRALPKLPAAAIPPDAPAPTGVTAITRVYGSTSGASRQIQYERHKVERDLPAGSKLRALADEALETAELLSGADPSLNPSAAALARDAAALRYYARGDISSLQLTMIAADGSLVSTAVGSLDQLPPDLLIVRSRAVRAGQTMLRSRHEAIREGMASSDELPAPFQVRALELGSWTTGAIQQFLSEVEVPTAETAQLYATELLDLALSVSPASWPKDVYEAVSGSNLITGEPMDGFGRTAAILGAITFGSGDAPVRAIASMRRLLEYSDRPYDAIEIVRASRRVDQGLWDNLSSHARRRVNERGVPEDQIDDALNRGRRFWDAKEDSILTIEPGDLTGESQRAAVALSWRDNAIKTVEWETRTDAQLLKLTFEHPDGRDLQRYFFLPDTPGLDLP